MAKNSKAKEYIAIWVDGELYRCDEWPQRSCSEILVRGPFPNGCFYPSGAPVILRDHRNLHTAFKIIRKLHGAEGMATDPKKSTKNWKTDPDELADWEPFYVAWHKKKYGEESI